MPQWVRVTFFFYAIPFGCNEHFNESKSDSEKGNDFLAFLKQSI